MNDQLGEGSGTDPARAVASAEAVAGVAPGAKRAITLTLDIVTCPSLVTAGGTINGRQILRVAIWKGEVGGHHGRRSCTAGR